MVVAKHHEEINSGKTDFFLLFNSVKKLLVIVAVRNLAQRKEFKIKVLFILTKCSLQILYIVYIPSEQSHTDFYIKLFFNGPLFYISKLFIRQN